jgi:hypothetical protein
MLAFIKSRPDGIDFSERKLVGVGHSNGAGAMLVSDSSSSITGRLTKFLIFNGQQSPATGVVP